MARPLKRRDEGASLVEFALLAPLVFALLLGMITGGLALSEKNSMENAVREAARLGATLQESTTWADTVRAKAVEVSGGDLRTSDVCVALVKITAPNTETLRRSTSCGLPSSAEPSATSVEVGQCVVKVWAQRSSELNIIFWRWDLTLETENLNRFERSGVPLASCP